jgi:hypothetical protein
MKLHTYCPLHYSAYVIANFKVLCFTVYYDIHTEQLSIFECFTFAYSKMFYTLMNTITEKIRFADVQIFRNLPLPNLWFEC